MFGAVFDHPPEGREAGERLLRIQQGTRSAADYALEFRTVAAASGWNELALIPTFHRGLRNELKIALALWDDALTLDDLITRAIRRDNLHHERRETPRPTPTKPVNPRVEPHGVLRPSTPAVSEGEPMQIEHAHLSRAERKRRVELGLCLYCGESDHLLPDCPLTR